MKQNNLKVHPDDNVIVALTDLHKYDSVIHNNETIVLQDDVKAKHKFTAVALPAGSEVIMYGVLVGIVQSDLDKGSLLTTENLKHAANGFEIRDRKTNWNVPDISKFQGRTFNGCSIRIWTEEKIL